MGEPRPLIVGIGGTTREGSSSERALRYSLDVANDLGAESLMLAAADVDLPAYSADATRRTPRAHRLVEALRAADGVLLVSPAYHGGVSGLLKNAMDYAEDLRDDPKPYLDERAVGCVAIGAGWQAPVATLAQMRAMAHALRAWPSPLGVVVNSSLRCFDETGVPLSPYREQLGIVTSQVVGFARRGLGAATRYRSPTEV